MERLHPMMKYGNFIEVYNKIIMCMGDFRLIHLFQDSKYLVKNFGARAHLQHWLLRPCHGYTFYMADHEISILLAFINTHAILGMT